MEARKVYVSGGSTFVISLPKKWVRKTNLKPGDSLVVTEHGSSLKTMDIGLAKDGYVRAFY